MLLNVIKKHIRLAEFLFLVAIVAGSAYAMIYSAQKWDVWHDESFTAALVEYPPEKIVSLTAKDVHPPLYYLVLKMWSLVFGNDIVALRLFSVVTMLAALVSMYLLFRKLFGIKAAVAAGVCMALGPIMLRYGSEARMYAFATLLVSFQLHAFVDLLQGNRSRKTRYVYIASSIAAFYVHYYSLLVVLTQYIYLMTRAPAITRRPTLADVRARIVHVWRGYKNVYLPLCLAVALWLPIAARQALEIQTAFWIRWVGHESIYSTLTTFLLFRDSYGLVRYDLTLSLVAVSVFCLACWYLYRYDNQSLRQTYRLMAVFFVGPVALLFLASLLARSTYYERYFSMFGYVFYGLAGIVIYKTLCIARWSFAVRLLLVLCMVLSLGTALWRLQHYGDFDGDRNKYQMRAASDYIISRKKPSDVIVTKGLILYYDARYYFSDGATLKVLADSPLNGWGNTALVTGTDVAIGSLNDIETSGGTIWVIVPAGEQIKAPGTWKQEEGAFEKGYVSVYRYIPTMQGLYY